VGVMKYWLVSAMFVGLLSMISVQPVKQETPAFASTWPAHYVVTQDAGGLISQRVHYIEHVAKKVEIYGECNSSCTMLLSVPDVCVHPEARLGFHGPSFFGQPLPSDMFDHWSNVMAKYYPPDIRTQFMKTWRYSQRLHYVSGKYLNDLGFKRCRSIYSASTR
jgi:hypothetical protein